MHDLPGLKNAVKKSEGFLVLGKMYDIPRLKHEVEEMLLPRLDEYNAIYCLGLGDTEQVAVTGVFLTH